MREKRVNLPSMKDHVEEEPPDFSSLVGPVDKDGLDGHRARRVDLAHHHRIVGEESELTNKQSNKTINNYDKWHTKKSSSHKSIKVFSSPTQNHKNKE